MLFYVITLLFNVVSGGDLPTPTSMYTNKLTLVEPDVYILYWNYTSNDIVFETHVKVGNKGWSSFGLSPNGGMQNADITVTWQYANGSIHFTGNFMIKSDIY